MNRILLLGLFLLVLIGVYPCQANKAVSKPLPVVRLDSSAINAGSIPAQKLDKYRTSKDFTYLEKSPEGNGFWQYILQKIINSFGTVFNSRVSQVVFYIIFIGIFVLLLIVLFGADLQAIMAKNKSTRLNIPVITEDNIEGFDFDKVIGGEIDKGNYNRAVRYLYLKLLQVLTGNRLIVWQKEKTNRDYFRELLNTNYSVDFRTITSAYEYVWYGKFPLDKPNFEDINKDFNNFFTKLNG